MNESNKIFLTVKDSTGACSAILIKKKWIPML